MRNISDTMARLNAAAGLAIAGSGGADAGRLAALGAFGGNPGALNGWCYAPDDTQGMPLVVVLHGCTQNAAGYDRGSGWSTLAERFGFALLFPEQTRANNANGCFNWFSPEDTRRDGGEACSISQMIAAMIARHGIDPARVFVTGLSAGGAMTSVMLATYPELFAGGAIIAGLPYGAAASAPQAFDRMRGVGHIADEAYAAAIRTASAHRGRRPDVSVWHGDADRTVDVANADRILGQWRALHALGPTPDSEERVDGSRHRVWTASDGSRLEDYRVLGLSHGIPISTAGETACGVPMPFMLDAGISSTWRIAERWKLLTSERPVPVHKPPHRSVAGPAAGVQATIEAALRSAGLMRG